MLLLAKKCLSVEFCTLRLECCYFIYFFVAINIGYEFLFQLSMHGKGKWFILFVNLLVVKIKTLNFPTTEHYMQGVVFRVIVQNTYVKVKVCTILSSHNCVP